MVRTLFGGHYDKVYVSKVFSFTEDYLYPINADVVEKGGTGYDIHQMLPREIDKIQPDYSIYPQIDTKTAYGFLTRGCTNKCKWCVVPQKEGYIHPYMDVEEIADTSYFMLEFNKLLLMGVLILFLWIITSLLAIMGLSKLKRL